jgi:hypothetical protein
MPNLELKLGKMTSKEMAAWFGVAPKTYSNGIKGYLQKLEKFAVFEPVYGGVIIKEILSKTYDKACVKDESVFLEEVKRCVREQDGLLSLSGTARKVVRDDKDYQDTKASYLTNRFSKVAKEQFGTYWIRGDQNLCDVCGKLGMRERVWGVKLDDYNNYRPMTAEEEEIWYDLLENWNKVKSGEQVAEERKLFKQLKAKEISVESYIGAINAIDGDNFYFNVLNGFMVATGHRLVLISRYELGDFSQSYTDIPVVKNELEFEE